MEYGTEICGPICDDNYIKHVGWEESNACIYAGAAYVFLRDAGVWAQQAYLKASNALFGDRFGVSVAVSGDTAVVGAIFEDSCATGVNGNEMDNNCWDAGAAYDVDHLAPPRRCYAVAC